MVEESAALTGVGALLEPARGTSWGPGRGRRGGVERPTRHTDGRPAGLVGVIRTDAERPGGQADHEQHRQRRSAGAELGQAALPAQSAALHDRLLDQVTQRRGGVSGQIVPQTPTNVPMSRTLLGRPPAVAIRH
ncbi:hypothetical protein NKG94_01365 [Micromonospora sp. M12]